MRPEAADRIVPSHPWDETRETYARFATADAEAATKWRNPEVRDVAVQALWGLTSLKADLQARIPYAASRMATRLAREADDQHESIAA